MGSAASLLSNLHVEPVLLVFMMAANTNNLAIQQLMQDKLCLFKYDLGYEYCYNISQQEDSEAKHHVLGEVGFYLSMREYIVVLPHMILVIFSGSWCDRFKNGRKYVMLTSLLGNLIEALLYLCHSVNIEWDYRLIVLSSIPTAFLGIGLNMAAGSYITATVPAKDRTMRFQLIEIFSRSGIVAGFLLNGVVMNTKSSVFSPTGTRNHADVFFLNAILYFLCITWIFYRVKSTPISPGGPAKTIDNNNDEKTVSLFSMQDVRDILSTLTKKRKGNDRTTMWLIIFIHASVMTSMFGLMYLIYPLCELLYKWDIQTYGVVAAITSAIVPVMISLFTVIVVKPLKPSDMEVIIIGLISGALGFIAVGSITTKAGFFAFGIIGSLNVVTLGGIRSFLSNKIPITEISKVFSIMQLVETLLMFLSPAVASVILRTTISSYPTFVYHCFASFFLISLTIATRMDVFHRMKLKKEGVDASSESGVASEKIPSHPSNDDTCSTLEVRFQTPAGKCPKAEILSSQV